MQLTTSHALEVMSLPLAVVAVVILVSPQTFAQLMRGQPVRKPGWEFVFLRVAAAMMLVSIIWKWLEWTGLR